MNIEVKGLQFYADQLRNNKKFAFVRYGNGEWDCILSLYHTTRSGSQRFDGGLRNALAKSLVEQRTGAYYTAMQSTSFLERVKVLPLAETWIAQNAPGLTWYDGEVFTKASMKGQLYPLVSAMKTKRIVVVGPKWLMKLPFSSVFIPVRSRDCWQDIDRIEEQLRTLQNVVVSISAGPMTKVLIHRLQPVMGGHSWLIDFGSVWDPYCGVHSRRYHKRLTPEIIRRNLTGK